MDNSNLNTTKDIVSKASSLLQEKASVLQTGSDKYSTFKEEIKVTPNSDEKNIPPTEVFVDSDEDEKKKKKMNPIFEMLDTIVGKKKDSKKAENPEEATPPVQEEPSSIEENIGINSDMSIEDLLAPIDIEVDFNHLEIGGYFSEHSL